MFRFSTYGLCALLLTAAAASPLWAQHSDIHFGADSTSTRLIVEGEAFAGVFGDFGVEYFTDDPGFAVSDVINGSLYPLVAGDAVSFNVLTGLLYSDGAESLVGQLINGVGFQFTDELLALRDAPIRQIVDTLTELGNLRKIAPEEVDDFTLVGLEIP